MTYYLLLSLLSAALILSGCATAGKKPTNPAVAKHHDAPQPIQYFVNGELVTLTVPEGFWLIYADGDVAEVTEAEYNAANVPEREY